MATKIRYDSTSYYTYHVVVLTRGTKSAIMGVYTNMEGAAMYVQRMQEEMATANITGGTLAIKKYPHNEGMDIATLQDMIDDELI